MRYQRPVWLIIPIVLTAFAFVQLEAETAGKPPVPLECRWATGPVVVDGTPDDPVWKEAQLLDNFHLAWLGKDDRPAKTATRARLLWDHQNLYFLAEMDDADLFADVTEHDGQTWDNDVFEMFFRPAGNKPGYYEFQVNAAGTVFDVFFPRQNLKSVNDQKKVGTFHIEQKVRFRGTLNKRDDVDRGWTVEGRIPWTDFRRTGGRPLAGEEWRFALCRYDYNQNWPQPELSSVAPLQARKSAALFHQLEDYSTLRFTGPKNVNPPPGLDRYTPITTSTVVGSPDPPLPYRMKRAYPQFSPAYLINVRAIPGSDQLLYLSADRKGSATTLYRITDQSDMAANQAVKVMETPDDGTAYDIAFHPQFAKNGYVYVGWNGAPEKGTRAKTCRITRYTMGTKAPYHLNEQSALTIVEWPSNGHNGAAVCFGRDGNLYVTTGDGTSDSDTNLMGQNTDTLLSKVLRLDVDHPSKEKPYSIPKDNPFVSDKRFAPETFAYGLRNPWRIACDSKTGHIWVGNNGQDVWETAHLVRPGDNYGWSVLEGSHPFYLERKAGPTPFTKPTIEHNHAEFRSLTGGIVYYGEQLPDLNGVYIYGDHSTGRTWGMLHDGTKPVWHRELARGPHHISAYSTNTRGELLICDHGKAGEGGLYTLTPTPKDLPPSTFPRKLSESGLFDSVRDHKLKRGAIPYSVNAEFWSDGLHKERFIVLPPGGTILYAARRGWDFPDKTVLVKSFAIEQEEGNPASRKWIETRFLTRQDSEWIGYTYVWNEAGTDAELLGAAARDQSFPIRVPKSATHPDSVRQQVWHYPSRTECMICHARAAKFTLGLSHLQMNKRHDYGNGYVENQLVLLDRLGLFGKSPNWAAAVRADMKYHAELLGMSPADADEYVKQHAPQPGQRAATLSSLADLPGTLAKLADPYDPTENLNFRARSWIHANCAYCHVEAGGGNAAMVLEFHTPASTMKIFDEKPLHSTFNIPEARLIACGAPDQSVLFQRIHTRGTGQMPPLASSIIDAKGTAMIREWITSLKK